MSNEHTRVQATNPDGGQLSVSRTTTDSPILPAANLQQLQQIDPKLVPWVIEQTEKEANFRRSETHRINGFVFIERISGVIAGAIVAIVGLIVAGYLVYSGHDWAGAVVGGATLVAIVTVLVTGKKGSEEKPLPGKQPKKRR